MRLAEAFRRNLKCLIAEHNVNVKEMAETLHISRTNIYRYINEDTVPTLDIAWLIAEYFGITIDELCEGADRCDRRRKAK